MLWGPQKVVMHVPLEPWIARLPRLGFVGLLVMLGTYTPDRFTELLRAVAVSIGG